MSSIAQTIDPIDVQVFLFWKVVLIWYYQNRGAQYWLRSYPNTGQIMLAKKILIAKGTSMCLHKKSSLCVLIVFPYEFPIGATRAPRPPKGGPRFSPCGGR